ncbi:MAG: hypothetical protein ACFE96_15415 [Candidatus Hermodarchaeota archaeon]
MQSFQWRIPANLNQDQDILSSNLNLLRRYHYQNKENLHNQQKILLGLVFRALEGIKKEEVKLQKK